MAMFNPKNNDLHSPEGAKPMQREHVGIFTSWNFHILSKAEDEFKKHLDACSTYPFIERYPGVYELKIVRCVSPRFWGAALVNIALVVGAIVTYWWQPVDQYIVFILIPWLATATVMEYHAKNRVYVVDTNEKYYKFFRGDHLVYYGHFHNIYIRLRGIKSANGDMYVSACVGGYMIDTHRISGESDNIERMRRLCRRLATRLNLNYFDFFDTSPFHVIRHRCPYEIGEQVQKVDSMTKILNYRKSIAPASKFQLTGPYCEV